MNKIVATIGAAALSTTAFHAANAINLSPQDSTKSWSVGVSLRGFYDDNYLVAPRDPAPGQGSARESFGFEVRPTVGLNIPLEQTYIGFDYTFSGQWYEDRSNDQWDTSHIVSAILNHEFTERVTLDLKDTFVYSTRPELLDPDFSTLNRTGQNNLNNRGHLSVAVGLTPRLGLVIGYQNKLWDYQEDNPAAETAVPVTPSLSAQLDRIEHRIPVNLRYQIAPETTGLVGYEFGMVGFTSDEFLTITASGAQRADVRNNRSHRGYVGIEHNFTPAMNVGAKGGVTYTEYYNDPASDNNLTPYADASFAYSYAVGSRAEAGFTFQQSQTDVYSPSATQVTQDRLSASIYGRLVHEFMPQLHGSLFAQYQHSEFNGGAYDAKVDSFITAGVSLSYKINPFLTADLSYYYDYLDSDIPYRSFDRNRVFLGVTAAY